MTGSRTTALTVFIVAVLLVRYPRHAYERTLLSSAGVCPSHSYPPIDVQIYIAINSPQNLAFSHARNIS